MKNPETTNYEITTEFHAIKKIEAFAEETELGFEIAEAIHYTADGDLEEMYRIRDTPRDTELLAIWERVTNNSRNTEGWMWDEETSLDDMIR